MSPAAPDHLKARKSPIQKRSAVTLDAIFEATVQVLIAEGPQRLTTTRVAQRAGVSVGTMYQYFPHKQALIYALTVRHLSELAEKIETVCAGHEGVPAKTMIDAVLGAYWEAKLERPHVTRALYLATVEIDNVSLIQAFADRIDAATHAMLASASELPLEAIPDVNRALVTVIFGAVRAGFERNLSSDELSRLRIQVSVMCGAYLQTISGGDRPETHLVQSEP